MNRRIAKAASQPARKSLTAVSLSIAALFAVPTAHAFELKLEDGWKGSLDTTVSLGTSWRMQSADPKLYSAADGARIPGIPTGTGGSNTDSGNLNWDKGDQFSTLLKVTSDLSLSKGDMGAFARIRAWYDYALEDQTVRAGHHGNDWTLNSKLSDSGYDRLQKFSGVALLDAYAYNTFDVAGKPLQLRFGNQVINWGESLFVQGVNQINPIDLSALRKPGAEVKDAFLPITALSANLGLGEGKSLEVFYQFRWTPSNIDSCGAYFGVVETQLTTSPGKPCSTVITTSSVPLTSASRSALATSAQLRGNSALATVISSLPVGSTLSNYDATRFGYYVPMTNGKEGDDGQFGVAFRFPIEQIDSELGVYAAKISSRIPFASGIAGSNLVGTAIQGDQSIAANTLPRSGLQFVSGFGLTPGRGYWEYPGDTKVFGVSLGTNLAGWSVGAELSHSPNQPVQINVNDLLTGLLSGLGPMGGVGQRAASVVSGPDKEVAGWDRVSKSQFQVNAVKLFPQLMGSAQGVVVGEVAAQSASLRSDRRYGRAFIFGTGHSPLLGVPSEVTWCQLGAATNPQPDGCKNDGYATENSWGYRMRLGLEYPNFLNTGVTLFPTFSFSHDVSGYSVDNQFIEDRKVYGASFRFNIQRVHNIELSYIQYGDSAKYDPFRDRDFISLVFSTSF